MATASFGRERQRLRLAAASSSSVVFCLRLLAETRKRLIIPIAQAIADDLNASSYPFAMTIALGAPAAFMTTISRFNALVATAGNYGFGDVIHFGSLFSLLTMGVTVIMVAWLFPFS